MGQIKYFFIDNFTVTNGPMNITVCNRNNVNIPCAFTGAPASLLFPTWRITRRSDNGSVVIETVAGSDIDDGVPVNGLLWIPDVNTPNNSVLRVGPVNDTFNQSTYQCVLVVDGPDTISTIGTLTVVGEYFTV